MNLDSGIPLAPLGAQGKALFVDAIAEVPPGDKPAFVMEVTDDLLARTGALEEEGE